MPGAHADLPEYPFSRPENSYEPSPELGRLRQQGPVHRIQFYDGTPGWIVVKHKQVCELLDSKKFSNERFNRHGYPEIHPGGKKTDGMPTFVHMDDPRHTKQRHMVEDFFTLDAVKALPHVNRAVESLLSDIQQKGCSNGPVDLVDEFTALVNPKVIFALFGIPEKDADELAKYSGSLGGTSGTAGESGHTKLHDYLDSLIDERIQKAPSPQNDVISRLAEQYRAGNLMRDEVNLLAFTILIAGNTAITSSISLGILTLLQHPDQLNEIRRNPELTTQAVEEILRYHTPSALNSRRVAIEDVEVGGKHIKAGEGVIGSVRSGNRDADVFPDADRFDIHRRIDQGKNLAFGHGPHRCQAEWLSRKEIEVAIATLAQKFPSLKLAVSPEKLEYTPPTQNVGVLHLPVYF